MCYTELQFKVSSNSIKVTNQTQPELQCHLHFYVYILQATASACALLGFGVIYINKNINNKPHFTSWHGILGTITVLYFLLQAFGGIALKFKLFVGNKLTLAQNKLYHATSGLVFYLLALATLFLGMSSMWFAERVQGVPHFACLGTLVILGLIVTYQVVRSYGPRQ